MPSRIASELVEQWKIPVAAEAGAVRYSSQGDWYHGLRRFPGVLIDATGYVVFASEREWLQCPQLRIGPRGDVAVRGGIAGVYRYVRMVPR